MKIIVANPRGFCAGVDRAIDTVKLALEAYGKPVYVKHAIVHNEHVVQSLEQEGAVFVERVEDIPAGAVAVFSAHGSPPQDYTIARERKLQLIDATCPLVTKVHLEAKRYAREGYQIILIGHAGHIELVGTSGEAPEHTTIVTSLKEIAVLTVPDPERVIILTQTTLSVDDTAELVAALRRKFPQAISPPSSDICYATTNRQAAVRALAKVAPVILVVGSQASSNTNRLVDVAQAAGANAYRIDGPGDIEVQWLQGAAAVGLTAGASAPESLVQSVIAFLQRRGATAIEELRAVEEKVWFDIPRELKETAKQKGVGNTLLAKHTIHQDSAMSRS